MAKPPHWLDGVAKVLRADTDDLRKLAKIGGVDPRTAYVGTRLDGTDLRGQDLRGMVFTDLDLSRVKHDAKTRIDSDQLPAEGPPILVLSSRLDLVDAERRLGELSPQLFGPDQVYAFFDNVRVGYPAIVLAFEAETDLAEDVLSSIGKDGLPWALIVQARDPVQWLKRWPDLASERYAFFTQEFGLAKAGRASSIAVETRFLCHLLADNWDELMAREGPPTLFMRAQGVGPRPILDAGAQLFDRLWREELHLCDLRLAFVPGEMETAETLGLNTLFNWDVNLLRSSPAIVSAFVDLGNALLPERYVDNYSRHTLMALHNISPAGNGSRIFVGSSGARLPVSDLPLSPTNSPAAITNSASFRAFDFTSVTEILISQSADVATVVNNLIRAGEFWVSARDVLGVDNQEVITIWSLLATQMRRFGSQPSGAARQAYLQLILRAAMRWSGREVEWLEPLLDDTSVIRVEDLEFGLGRTSFKATITFGGMPPYIRLAVRIEPDGPSLSVISTKGVPPPYRAALP